MRGTSTVDEVPRTVSARALWGRRSVMVAIALLLILDLTRLTGLHTATVHAERDGWTLDVAYPQVARPGLDVRFHIDVRRAGGLGGQFEIALSNTWLDIFETQGLWPTPDSQRRIGNTTYLEFDQPPGDHFALDYDAYIQPLSQRGRPGSATVLVAGRPVVSVTWNTHLLP